MKNLIFVVIFFASIFIYAQTTVMIAVVLEDSKENRYLQYEKNWNKVADK